MSGNPAQATQGVAVGKRTRRSDNTAREIEAMRLRLTGLDYAEIATRLGYADKSGAYRAVTRGLDSLKHETAREVLDLELGRLDALLSSVWPSATAGDLAAFDRVLKIMDRRAKYLGLDRLPEPVPHEHPKPSEDEVLASLALLAARRSAILGD